MVLRENDVEYLNLEYLGNLDMRNPFSTYMAAGLAHMYGNNPPPCAKLYTLKTNKEPMLFFAQVSLFKKPSIL